ncbi:hypothetical protein OESDEN_17120, partial [Oesophagostomum dentatum]
TVAATHQFGGYMLVWNDDYSLADTKGSVRPIELQKPQGYIDRISGQQPETAFLHDNAKPHTAKLTQDELRSDS